MRSIPEEFISELLHWRSVTLLQEYYVLQIFDNSVNHFMRTSIDKYYHYSMFAEFIFEVGRHLRKNFSLIFVSFENIFVSGCYTVVSSS